MASFHTCHLPLGNTSFCEYSNTLIFLPSLELFQFPLLKPVQRQILVLENCSSWKPPSNWARLFPQCLVLPCMHLFLFIRRGFWQPNMDLATGCQGLRMLDAAVLMDLGQPLLRTPQRYLLDGDSSQAQRGSRDKYRALPYSEYKYI